MPGKVLAWPRSYESNLKWGVRAELRLVHVAVVPPPSAAWGSVAPRADRHVLVGFSFSLLLANRLVSMRTVLGLGSRGTSVDGVAIFCGIIDIGALPHRSALYHGHVQSIGGVGACFATAIVSPPVWFTRCLSWACRALTTPIPFWCDGRCWFGLAVYTAIGSR